MAIWFYLAVGFGVTRSAVRLSVDEQGTVESTVRTEEAMDRAKAAAYAEAEALVGTDLGHYHLDEVLHVSPRMISKFDSSTMKYAVDAMLGKGGYGVTYRVTDQRTSVKYAIKLLHENLDEVDLQSERSGCLILQKLQRKVEFHRMRADVLMTCLEIFETGNGRYAVLMDLEPGKDIEMMSLSAAEADHVTHEVAYAVYLMSELAYGHRPWATVMHRDIKPGNVMFDRASGKVTLVDFGKAGEFEAGIDKNTECLFGQAVNPMYYDSEFKQFNYAWAPPEGNYRDIIGTVCEGSLAPVSNWDVYSVGVLFFVKRYGASDSIFRPRNMHMLERFRARVETARRQMNAESAARDEMGERMISYPAYASCTAPVTACGAVGRAESLAASRDWKDHALNMKFKAAADACKAEVQTLMAGGCSAALDTAPCMRPPPSVIVATFGEPVNAQALAPIRNIMTPSTL